ncbi:unnamed protein product [Peronospora farinosa]|uniref:AN1-type domain-containing protein n=1 Tax=Peronospora farinosa TaxID=134698 RepID=A0AAV0THZ8_9STRA|nr:unnamed protein product [Peronospora farinosa]CAI5722287.1 unnamed protein product [Peronospora farinosa]
MAHSSSSVFNEVPSSTEASEMVTKTSSSSNAPTDASVSSASATATATASSTVVATTSSPTSSDCLQVSTGAASPSVLSSADDSLPSSTQKYTCVPPAVLQSVKTSLTFRKSCLKRSKSSTLPLSVFCEDSMAVAKQVTKIEEKKEGRPVQKNRRRCWECKRKVGLAAVKCRCDYTFCGKHRYAEEHKCVFNFKTAGKRKLEEENPVVVPSKVARIN